MTNIDLIKATERDFETFYSCLESDFHVAEYRTKQSQQQLLYNNIYTLYNVVQDNTIVGYISCWNLDGFVYIEHFVILPQYRSLGIGGKVISLLMSQHNIVLEAEQSTVSPQAVRRQQFYLKLGLIIQPAKYLQCPLREDSDYMPLDLYCSKLLNDTDYNNVVDQLLTNVYKTTRSQYDQQLLRLYPQ